jgi:serine/threonine-protein kinase
MSLQLEIGARPVTGYSLVRPLGRGGFGEVWEALAPGGVRVALKFIRLDTKGADCEQRALEVIRNIRHPHLLDVQFATRVDDCMVIAMPLCDASLMDRLRACQETGLPGVPRDELLAYMDEVARAVDFLNEARHPAADGGLLGVQHRDIKPHNIFVVGGSARLADFGMAKMLETSTTSHTGPMSPHYVAPELLEGHVSNRSDQYSLGVTYVQLRTGKMPFTGETVNQILFAHIRKEPDLTALPAEERPVVARALAKRPEQRWPTCRAFVQGLRAAAGPVAEGSASETTSRGFVPPAAAGMGDLEAAQSTLSPDTSVATDPSTSASHVPAAAPAWSGQPAPGPRPLRRLGLAGVALGCVLLIGLLLGQAGRKTPPPEEAAEVALLEAARSTEPPPRADARKGVAEPQPRPAPPSPPAPVTPPPVVEPAEPPPAAEPEPARPTGGEAPREVPADPPPTPPSTPTPTPTPTSTTTPTPTPTPPAPPIPAPPADPPPTSRTGPELARQARAILKTYCYRCHGVRFEVPGYNVLDRDVLVARRDKDEPTYVVPGKPEASYLWERLGVDKDMPPTGPRPSDEERALIARWIGAGAPFPEADRAARPRRTERDVLAAIRDHLAQVRKSDRVFLRYLTLHNLQNDKDVDDADLRLTRAAVAKLLNSLSWEAEIVVPQVIDRDQVVLAFDLRDVGWDRRDLWSAILQRYPYGLKHDQDPDREVRALAEDVYAMAGTSLPFLRADWFVANASRPPLYHELLDLPDDARVLENRLKVDVEADFRNDKLARAGFATSGVSGQNRLVERHSALYGAYWLSYDFKKNEGTSNLFRYPLGPVFTGNPHGHQAFEHAGGEIIFHLPNGLQGYLLVDGHSKRIDAGPIEVVSDALKTSGTAAIVTGLSCMACHRHGTIPLKDTVRDGQAVAGSARDKVERLYPTHEAMDRLLARDESRFLKALEAAMGPFLKVGEDQDKPIRDFAEPIGAVARAYLKDLGPVEVAADLGFSDPKELTGLIRANARLREFGLAPLLRDATIKRTEWDSLEGGLSRFQQVARELELGTPFRSF